MKERKLDPAATAIIDKTDTVNITAEHKKREFVDIVLLSGCNRKVNFKKTQISCTLTTDIVQRLLVSGLLS